MAEREMPFLDHLEELRKRLFWIAGSLFVGVIAAFTLIRPLNIFSLLQLPILKVDPELRLITTGFPDAFSITLSASLILGVLFASPVIFYQLWAFFSPGLHRREKRVIIPVLFAGLLLFLAGVALCFFLVMPITLRFLSDMGDGSFQLLPNAREYFGFLFAMCFAFGAMFEMPIVVLALSALGIVNPRVLNKFRRYAIVILLVLSALITPDANPTTLMLLFVPLYLLYEVSLMISLLMQRQRERKARLENELQAGARESAPGYQ